MHGSSATSSSMHRWPRDSLRLAMQLTPWTSADTANQAPKATSPISGSWRTTSRLSNAQAQPSTLAGFSSGGGFVLRFAGSPRQELFSNIFLLFPWPAVRDARRCAAGLPWGFPSLRPCSTGLECTRLTRPAVDYTRAEGGSGPPPPHYFPPPPHNPPARGDHARKISARRRPPFLLGPNNDVALHASLAAAPF